MITASHELRADDRRARPGLKALLPAPGLAGRTDAGSAGEAGLWLRTALASLILAGLLALALVAGRIPAAAAWIGGEDFFRRCLVVHVNLSLFIWFSAFAASFFSMLRRGSSPGVLAAGAPHVARAGMLAMVVAAFLPGAAPVLANYVPVISHPLYLAGLGLVFAGLLACFADLSIWRNLKLDGSRVPAEAAAGIVTAALAFLLAAATFAGAWSATPRAFGLLPYYESVMWGPGHVLQVANVAAMMAVWLWLLHSLSGRPMIRPREAAILFGALLLPHLISPLLTMHGTGTGLYRNGFTRLMQFGIFPAVTVALGLLLFRIGRAWRQGVLKRSDWTDYRLLGFAASAALTVVGFLLGASIRGSNTMVPAHYHASIGAVTIALMAITYHLLPAPASGRAYASWRRLAAVQLGLFGGGQLIFSLGFALGGLFGLGRKAYGGAQEVASAGAQAGLAVMGLGGLLAVTGGLMFLVLASRQVRRGRGSSEEFENKPTTKAAQS